MATKLEKKFPEFVRKNKLSTKNNYSSLNYEDYQNRVRIRNMKYNVEKLFNQ